MCGADTLREVRFVTRPHCKHIINLLNDALCARTLGELAEIDHDNHRDDGYDRCVEEFWKDAFATGKILLDEV